MPITRGAIKKLRQDKTRRTVNLRTLVAVKETLKNFRKNPTAAALSKVYSMLDIAGKKGIYKSNKISRLKSRLTKLLSRPKTAEAKPKKAAKKAAKKSSAKKKS